MMRFSDLRGNGELVRSLTGMVDGNKVPHAVMIYENEGCGALPLVLAWLQYMHCGHPSGGDSCGECPSCRKFSKLIHSDLHFVFPTNTGTKSGNMDSKDISSDFYLRDFRDLTLRNPYFLEQELQDALGIDRKECDISLLDAKRIQQKIMLSPVEDGWKMVVMLQPEKMNTVTANKLLKSLEEPPEKTIFVLITHNPEKVLQTISSRCRNLRMCPLSREEVREVLTGRFSVEKAEAEKLAATCGGSVGVALSQVGGNEGREAFMNIFGDLLQAVADRDLLSALETAEFAAALESREKQKQLLAFIADGLRKLFLVQQGMENISYADSDELDFYRRMSGRISRRFSRLILQHLDRASMLLSRNVSQKMIFADLASRMVACNSAK
ncbi:MAG: hypothetical protein HUJ94_04610 [Bacteroidales bacterium]|nr:hypothetical protein [Bacteroidales bacterium]